MSNIIFISGTPCTGKTTISENLSEKLNWELVKINDLAISNNLVLGIDEDKGYKIIDIDALNELDKLIVLRCRPEILKERLALRNYSSSKINENLEAEALGVCSAESLDIYEDNVYELDVSDLDVDGAVLIIMDVINGQKELSFGEIDFMDWLITNH